MTIRSKLLFATILGALTISVPAFAEGPEFKVDASWPKQLPNNWIIGQIGGMNVDAQDHIWVFQRPRSLKDVDLAEKKHAKCCVAAPSVIEFDAAGNVVSSWGGPGYNPDWPEVEHGIFVDGKNNILLTGSGNKDGTLLKYTRDGKFLAKFGKQGPTAGSQDSTALGGTASIALDAQANELFLSDGYFNHRVIVLDADSLAYQADVGRLWQGANRYEAAELQSQIGSSSPIPSIACGSPMTGSSMSATGPMTASRCSRRTAPS